MPIPGSPPTRTSEPGHEAATQDSVELGDAETQARQVGVGDLGQSGGPGDRLSEAGPGRPRRSRWLPDDRLDQAVPLAAVPALALPAQEGLGAALADEAALRPRHA